SLPEVATSLIAALRGQRDMAIGNAVGSCLFNLLCILGVCAVITPIPVPLSARYFDLPVMTAVAILCLPIFFTGGRIARREGALLLGYYVAYTVFLLLRAQEHASLVTYERVMLIVLPLTVLGLAVPV